MKYTLTLNSHQLSDFQRCETNFMYSHLLRIEPLAERPAFQKGKVISRWLNLYYHNKIKPKESIPQVLYNPLIWTGLLQKELKCSPTDAFTIYKVLVSYERNYKHESWIPRGIEVGFSKILYEDSENLFVYEGRMDLLAEVNGQKVIVDHKSQSQTYYIYEFNNQCLGYLWATGATEFVYNYLVLTKEPKFHRAVHKFNPSQIEDWCARTTQWYFRLKKALEEKNFLESLQCETKFGKCQFSAICEQPKEDTKLHVIRCNFKTKKPYRSW